MLTLTKKKRRKFKKSLIHLFKEKSCIRVSTD